MKTSRYPVQLVRRSTLATALLLTGTAFPIAQEDQGQQALRFTDGSSKRLTPDVDPNDLWNQLPLAIMVGPRRIPMNFSDFTRIGKVRPISPILNPEPWTEEQVEEWNTKLRYRTSLRSEFDELVPRIKWVPEAKNRRDISCSFNAIHDVLELLWSRHVRRTVKLSAAWLRYIHDREYPAHSKDTDVYPEHVLSAVKKHGIPEERFMPINNRTPLAGAVEDAAKRLQLVVRDLSGGKNLHSASPSISLIINELRQGRPVIQATQVPYFKDRSKNWLVPRGSDEIVLHTQTIVGHYLNVYHTEHKYSGGKTRWGQREGIVWEIRQVYGPTWGDNGYGWFPHPPVLGQYWSLDLQ